MVIIYCFKFVYYTCGANKIVFVFYARSRANKKKTHDLPGPIAEQIKNTRHFDKIYFPNIYLLRLLLFPKHRDNIPLP